MRVSPYSPHLHVSQTHASQHAGPAAARVDHSRGYPVGDGTFASSARGTAPQKELDLQLAMMANDAYESEKTGATGTQSERELKKAGWQRLRRRAITSWMKTTRWFPFQTLLRACCATSRAALTPPSTAMTRGNMSLPSVARTNGSGRKGRISKPTADKPWA